jgi:hypothetical protein
MRAPVRFTPGSVTPLCQGVTALPQWYDRTLTTPDPRYCSYLVVVVQTTPPGPATALTLVSWIAQPTAEEPWYKGGYWGDPVDTDLVPFQYWSPVPLFLLAPRHPAALGSAEEPP